jgi:hypothetical protein
MKNQENIKNKSQIEDSVYDLCQILSNNLTNSECKAEVTEIFRKRLNEYLDELREDTNAVKKEPNSSDLFRIITHTFSSLIQLYKNSDNEIKRYIFLLGCKLLQDQVSKADNIKVINVLLQRFHGVIFNHELEQNPYDKNNLERASFRIFSEITFHERYYRGSTSDIDPPRRDYLIKLNRDFYDKLCRLVDHDQEEFIYDEIFKDNIFRFQDLTRFSEDNIDYISQDLIYSQSLDTAQNSQSIYPLKSRIQSYYDVDPENNNIDEVITDLKAILLTINANEGDKRNYVIKVKNGLEDIYNYNLLILSIFEFLAYAYNKQKYNFISKLINYRYYTDDSSSIPILLPNHFSDSRRQLNHCLYLIFHYLNRDEIYPSCFKPAYLYSFTVIYICYCFIQREYGRVSGSYNSWLNRMQKKQITYSLEKIFKGRSRYPNISDELSPYFEAINQIQTGLESDSPSKNPESEKAIELFKELTRYENAFRASSSPDQKQFFKDELNQGLNQAKEFFKMVSEFETQTPQKE